MPSPMHHISRNGKIITSRSDTNDEILNNSGVPSATLSPKSLKKQPNQESIQEENH